MTFLPRNDLLTLEELERLCTAFISRGVDKIRITGGEPLVRRNVISLFKNLGRHLNGGGLRELTLTTNGSQLGRHAKDLYDAGVKRINVSLDSLDPAKFESITRWGRLDEVLDGIKIAQDVGLKIKINAVALKGFNEDEIDTLITWCGEQDYDLTLIETMPMGEIDEDRFDQYIPLSVVRERIEKKWTLQATDYETGGPSEYSVVGETGKRLGFITPLSHKFCESCNRVRLTCTGQLYLCLGQDDKGDLRTPLRQSDEDGLLLNAIDEAIGRKPEGHDFVIDRPNSAPAVARHMSLTGG